MNGFLNSVVIVEPHADDAFLSMGGHIEKWKDREISICTIFSGTRNRLKDAKSYADAVKANHIPLGFLEGEGFNISDESFIKLVKDSEVFVPIYLTNQEHKDVKEFFQKKFVELSSEIGSAKLLFYLDQPYAMKQKNAETINKYLNEYRLISYLVPSKNKLKHIPLFKDQSKFFYFEKESIEKIIEMIFHLL